MKKYLTPLLLVFILISFASQASTRLDSLKNLMNQPNLADTSSVILLSEIGQESWTLRISYWDSVATLAEKTLLQPLPPSSEKKIQTYLSACYNNMGYIYNNKGNIPKGLEYYHKSLAIDEQLGDKSGMSYCLNNIGYIHDYQGEKEIAMDYYKRALNLRVELGDKDGIAKSYINIGATYQDINDYERALEYVSKALEIARETKEKRTLGACLNNIGRIYAHLGDTTKALEFYQESYTTRQEISDLKGMATNLYNLGLINFHQGHKKAAFDCGYQCMEIANTTGHPLLVKRAAELLKLVYQDQKKYDKALAMYELQIQMRDSISNEETNKAAIRQQTQYEFEKEQLLKEQTSKEQKRLAEIEIYRRNNLQYSLIFLVILVVFGATLSLGFVKATPMLAEGLIFFAFLILFEFVLVLIDPYIDGLTNGEPIYKLLINALLAAFIFPLHAFFERALKKKLT